MNRPGLAWLVAALPLGPLPLGLLAPAQDGAPALVVTETYTNLQDRPLSSLPVTFSRVGCAGDFTHGIAPVVDGRALPAQVDALARHADGSVRHALVSFVLPSAAAHGQVEIGYADQAPADPPPFEWALPPEGELVLELTDDEERTWVSTVALAGPPGGPLAGARILVDGPIMKEVELHDVPSSADGEPHPAIDVLWRLRAFTGQRSLRVEVAVETTRLRNEQASARLQFHGLRLRHGETELLAQGPFEQLDRTRFRRLAWTAEALENIHRRPDVAYLERGRFLPPYRPGGPGDGRIDAAAAERRYLAHPLDLRPLRPGVIHAHMPGTGDRPDIGPYPGWALAYLYSGSPRLYGVLLHAEGNGSGAFPMHLRRAPDTPGVLYGPDRRAIEARYGLRLPSRKETESRVEPDRAHAPSLGYLGYLLTGDRFYAEEMSFWASYQLAQWPWGGIDLGAPERLQAWGLRHLVDAAFLLPDDHPLKDYFTGEVNAYADRVAALAEDSGRRIHWLRELFRISGRAHWVNCKRTSPWQHAWIVWSLGNAADKGFERAEGPRAWTAEYLVGLYTSEDEFTAPDGKTYRFDPRDAMQYDLATSLHEHSTEQRHGQTHTQLGRKLRDFDSYAEAWYWTKVNADNAYSDAKGLRRRPDADGVWPLNDPGWGHGLTASGERAYNWNRYGAWVGLVSAVNAEVPGAEKAWEVMVALAGPGSQHGFDMQPRALAGPPITSD